MAKVEEVRREVASFADETSPTAASAFNRLYESSGELTYRCTLRDGGHVDVVAATGDEAALKAQAKQPGCYVTSITPVSR